MKQANVWRAAVLGVGVLIALAPFVVDAVRGKEIPIPATVEAVAKAVRSRFADGDCVVVRPAWFSSVLTRLTDMGRGTEAWPFEALMGSEDLDPLALGTCAHLWWIDFLGRRTGPAPLTLDEVLSAEPLPLLDPEVAVRAAVTRFEPRPLTRYRTLSRGLEKAEIYRGARGADGVKCRYRGDRHRCETDPWLDVRLEGRHVGHHEVYWPYVHPGPGDQDLRIVWPPDAAVLRAGGDPAWLIVRMGHSMEAVRHAEGTEVSVEIRIDGTLMDTVTLAPRRWELVHRVFPVAPGAAWPTVEFRIHTDDPNWRETLLDADFTDRVPAAYISGDGSPRP